jgi:hypothetical protein
MINGDEDDRLVVDCDHHHGGRASEEREQKGESDACMHLASDLVMSNQRSRSRYL